MKYFFIGLLGISLFYGCKEEEVNLLPTAPVLVAPAQNETQVDIDVTFEWQKASDPDGDEILYTLFVGEDSLNLAQMKKGIINEKFDDTLLSHKTYYWKVLAEDSKGGKMESSIWNFSTLNNRPDSVILSFPENGAEKLDTLIELHWLESFDLDDDDVNYRFYIDTIPNLNKAFETTQALNIQLSFMPQTKYYWKVEAFDAFGGKSVSEIREFSTGIVPPILELPQNTASPIEHLVATLTWRPSANSTENNSTLRYNVFLDTVPEFGVPYIERYSLTTTLVRLFAGKTYFWKVEVVNDQGEIGESETWSFATKEYQSTEASFIDERDGQEYKTIEIGEQEWTAENMNYDTGGGSYCYDDDESNCAIYGKLYTWEAALNVCPEGWKLPSQSDWEDLQKYISENGYEDATGVALKSISGWQASSSKGLWAPFNGSDEFGFNALASGDYTGGVYGSQSRSTAYWSNTTLTKDGNEYTYVWHLRFSNLNIYSSTAQPAWGRRYSVRCIKN